MRRATLATVGALLFSTVAGATIRNVPSAPYPTIQSAENASALGDIIQVAAGTYNENVLVDVAGLTIQGSCANPGGVIVDGLVGDVFTVTSSNVTLKCLTIRNGETGVYADPGTGIRLQSLRILSGGNDGVRIRNGDGFWIQALEVRGAQGHGIIVEAGDDGRVQSTTVRNVNADCIAFLDSSRTVVTGNTLLDCGDFGIENYGYDNYIGQNQLTNTGRAGLYSNFDRHMIVANTFRSSGGTWDALESYGDDCTISDNKVLQSYGDAIDGEGARVKILRNELVSISGHCVDFAAASDLLLSDNNCHDSLYGYNIDLADRGRVERNLGERLGFAAYHLKGNDMKVLNNRALWGGAENSFFVDCIGACEVRNNQSVGQNPSLPNYGAFLLELSSDGAQVTGNTATDGGGYGFFIDCQACTVSTNVAAGNGSIEAGVRSPGFYIYGSDNIVSFNQARENFGPGYIVDGNDNRLTQNSALKNLQEGYWVHPGSLDSRLEMNLSSANAAEGFDNDGSTTDFLSNVSQFNRRDCTNDVSIDQSAGNNCFDGSNFSETSQVDN